VTRTDLVLQAVAAVIEQRRALVDALDGTDRLDLTVKFTSRGLPRVVLLRAELEHNVQEASRCLTTNGR
jgi:hypothetical protein